MHLPTAGALWLFMVALLLAGAPRRSEAQAPVAVTATLTPTSPTYADPEMLSVAVTALSGPPSGSIDYIVDGGSTQTAPLTNGAVLISLGTQAPGAHSVQVRYDGGLGTSAYQTLSVTTADLPFAVTWTKGNIIYNHGGFATVSAYADNELLLASPGEGKLYRLSHQQSLVAVPTSQTNLNALPVTDLVAPYGTAIDAADEAFVTDQTGNKVVRLSAAGAETTLPFTGLTGPTFVAVDRAGANVYVNDAGNGQIVKLALATGTQTTVVSGIPRITAMALDAAGNLYFGQHSSYGPGTLYRLDTNGVMTSGYYGLTSPDQLAFDDAGNLYVSDDYEGMERFDTGGHRSYIDRIFAGPLAVDHRGNAYFVNAYGYRYLPGPAVAFEPSYSGLFYGDDSSYNTMGFSVPYGQSLAALDTSASNNDVREQVGGAGCGSFGACSQAIEFLPPYPGLHTGPLTETLSNGATLTLPFYGVGLNSNEAFDPGVKTTGQLGPGGVGSIGGAAEFEDGSLYVSDRGGNKVFAIGTAANPAVTPLAFAGLNGPTQVVVDGVKTVTVLDSGNNRLVSLTATGVQSVPYTGGTGLLSTVTALATDGSGTFYLGGTLNGGGTGVVALSQAGQSSLVTTTPAVPMVLAVNGQGDVWEVDGTTLRHIVYSGSSATATQSVVTANVGTPVAIAADPSGTVMIAEGTGGTVLAVRPDGSSFTLLSGLQDAVAVTADGRSLVSAFDHGDGYDAVVTDDRRTTVYAFGNQPVGVTSAARQGTLSDDGNLTLSGIGGLPGDSTFQQVASAGACVGATPNAGTSLVPGASCDLSFTFTPATATAYAETGDEEDSTYSPGADFTYRPLQFTGAGVQGPLAAISPATLVFPATDVNSAAATQAVTLSNNGTATLNIASATVSGAGFSLVSSACGTTLAAGASCAVTVGFTPATAGTATGSLVFTDDSSDTGTQTASLTGTGNQVAAPQASLLSTSVNFGNVVTGASSGAQTFTLSNAGNAALTISSVGVVGANAASFAIAGNTCGSSLAAGASCTIQVTFAPQSAGVAAAQLAVVDAVGTQTSALTGTGTQPAAPQAKLTPTTANFGTLNTGVASTAQVFTLSNAGDAALPVSSVSVRGANAGSFLLSGSTCGNSLAAGASCTMQVTFAPQSAGALSATLTVVDPVGTQAAALLGTGATPAAPQARLTPGSADFGTVNVGASGSAQTLTLSNGGDAALGIASVALSGPGAASFAVTASQCGVSLAAGASCTLDVTYTPTGAGSATAKLTVTDAVGTQTATLTGNAVVPVPPDFTVTATPATQSAHPGTAVVYKLQLLSADANNPFTTGVGLVATGLPSGATVSFSPASVVPGATGTTSTMTVQLPALSAASYRLPHDERSRSAPVSLAFGGLMLGLVLVRGRRRFLPPLLLLGVLATAGACGLLTGCGSTGNGFAIPTSTYTLSLTATGGTTSHSARVVLTVQ